MGKSVKKAFKEEYNRLKKAMDKILNPKKGDALSQLVLQPVRNRPEDKKYLRGTDLR